jgi:SNF2 family DNA or RNA helicase
MIRQYEFYYATPTYVKGQDGKTYQQTSTRRNSHFKFNVILTTYEMILRSDWAELSKIPWKALVVDEAHRYFVSETH